MVVQAFNSSTWEMSELQRVGLCDLRSHTEHQTAEESDSETLSQEIEE